MKGKRLTNIEFIERANLIHKNKFDYSKITYINDKTKLEIVCLKHGVFWQSPNSHLQGRGCNKCGRENTIKACSKNTQDFIYKAKLIHNNLYNYDNVNYIGRCIAVEIKCVKHGLFLQTPNTHLAKKGCPKCSKNISNKETAWLDILNIPLKFRHKQIFIENRLIRADAYDPNTNTIYEFYGDYWHGNPKKYSNNDINKNNKICFRQLYLNTINREEIIKKAGYNLITIWENDFKYE